MQISSPDTSTRTALPQPLNATLYLPRALTTPEPQQILAVKPGEEFHLTYPIENRSGSGGAKYPVFCVFEYDEKDGQHQTFLVRTAIRIEERQNWFIMTRWYWLAGLVVMGGGWIEIRRRA